MLAQFNHENDPLAHLNTGTMDETLEQTIESPWHLPWTDDTESWIPTPAFFPTPDTQIKPIFFRKIKKKYNFSHKGNTNTIKQDTKTSKASKDKTSNYQSLFGTSLWKRLVHEWRIHWKAESWGSSAAIWTLMGWRKPWKGIKKERNLEERSKREWTLDAEKKKIIEWVCKMEWYPDCGCGLFLGGFGSFGFGTHPTRLDWKVTFSGIFFLKKKDKALFIYVICF